MLEPLSIMMLTIYTVIIIIPLIYNYLNYNEGENKKTNDNILDETGNKIELPTSLVILVNNPENINVEEIISIIRKSYT